MENTETKLVMLVENEFDSSTDEAMTKSTKGELFCRDPDEVV